MKNVRYEYNGIDIKDKVSNNDFNNIFKIGNHYYNNYEDLKVLVNNIINSDNKDAVKIMVDSVSDLDLYPIEKKNYIASFGFNKRVFDFYSIMCALKDLGYDIENLKDENNCSMFIKYLDRIKSGLIEKIHLGLDIMVPNPINFEYKCADLEDATNNRKLVSNEYINGITLWKIIYMLQYDVIDYKSFLTPYVCKEKVKIK